MKEYKNKLLATFVLVINALFTILLTMPETYSFTWTGRMISYIAVLVVAVLQIWMQF